MKTFFLTFAAASILSLSQAAVLSVNCVTGGQILSTGVVKFSCNNALMADAGHSLSNMRVQVLASWSDSTTGTINGLTFDWATANGSTVHKVTANNDFIGTTAPQVNGNAVAISGSSFVGGVDFVTVTTSMNAGAVAFPDAQASTTINLIASQVCTPAPEPSTLVLMGSALVGLGFVGRRKN